MVKQVPIQRPAVAETGPVSAAWSEIERTLDSAIWQLADVHMGNGVGLPSQILGVDLRCRVIITMGSIRGLSQNLLNAARILMHESSSAAELKARIVNDPRYGETGIGVGSLSNAVPSSAGRFWRPDANEEIQSVLKRIADLQLQAWILRDRIADELMRPPETSD